MGHPLITGLAVWSSAPPVHTSKSPLVLNSAHGIFLCQLSMHNLSFVYDSDRDREEIQLD